MTRKDSDKVPTSGRLISVEWETEMKNSAAAIRGDEQSGATHFLHALAHDREAESGAALARSEERFPDSFAQVSRNAGARIFNRDRELIVTRISNKFHLSATRRRLQRIQQQVRHRIAQSRNTLAGEHRVRSDFALKTDALFARIRLKQMDERMQQLIDTQRLLRCALLARKAQQLRHALT